MVFADSTWRLMAQLQPQTLADLKDIPGVLEHKVAQYGERFISAINSYMPTQNNSQNTDRKYPKNTASGLPTATQIHT